MAKATFAMLLISFTKADGFATVSTRLPVTTVGTKPGQGHPAVAFISQLNGDLTNWTGQLDRKLQAILRQTLLHTVWAVQFIKAVRLLCAQEVQLGWQNACETCTAEKMLASS